MTTCVWFASDTCMTRCL